MTYAQKILALVPGGEMQRFGEQEVLLTWSAGEWTPADIAAAADIDEDMLAINGTTLSLSMPPEIADNDVSVTIDELLANVPMRCRKCFVAPADEAASWHQWTSGEAYEACFNLIVKCAELCHPMGDVDVGPIWAKVGEQCLTWVYG